MKKRILIYGLILLAGFITSFINSFSHPAIIMFLPGLLLGLALTIPHFKKNRKQIISIVTVPIFMTLFWLIILSIGFAFGIINNSYSDRTGVFIVGILSSLFFIFIIDQYYSIENKKMSYIIILILGIISAFICDSLYLESHAKELNIGKMIAIWEIIVGSGLMIFVKFDWMTNKN